MRRTPRRPARGGPSRQWRSRRAEWQLAGGGRWSGPEDLPACERGHGGRGHGSFLFTWPDGRHLNPDWISHEFSRLCVAAGVPEIRAHDVRHTRASLLLASGEHLKVVQERLGWASTAFMLDTYAHLLPGMQADAAERFAREIFGGDADEDVS
ncbi:MAG: tyrosine-type recombinase/integrase [Nitriliruptorales bacterium]